MLALLPQRLFLAGLALLLASHIAQAQQADDDEFPEYRGGLIAEYRSESGASCRRTDDVLKFVWQNASPDPRLPAGEFSATWRGRLFTIEPGEYQLHLYLAGEVQLELAGQPILTAKSRQPRWHSSHTVKLAYGYHPLEIRYRSGVESAELSLYWQGPRFALEPAPAWHLFHDPTADVPDDFEQGQQLVRALRCGACHELPVQSEPLPAPALTHLTGNVHREWLVHWLTQAPEASTEEQSVTRRMPHFALPAAEAEKLAAYLLAANGESKSTPPANAAGNAARGERLFLTSGCLACHQVGPLGRASLFGGGDLTAIAQKRPADFFARWLADPATINPAHRMPVFQLAHEEQADLAAYLQTLAPREPARTPEVDDSLIAAGKKLAAAYRCAACHKLPDEIKLQQVANKLQAHSDWTKSCLGLPTPKKHQPGFGLTESQTKAIQIYLRDVRPRAAESEADGQFVLQERNCIACHARAAEGGIAALLPAVVERVPELATELPRLTAPSLLGVGDKLHEAALAAAITTRDPPRRPWLAIRMPRFHLSEAELQGLIRHFVQRDRIPDQAPIKTVSSLPGKKELANAGGRLVTADGFGCTSCHQIGDWTPQKVALNARGTELSKLGDRLRKPWFDRWVRNPARMVPRMEMPSIVTPARKILDEKLEVQLAAVWHVLNQSGFTPPAPSAIRLVHTTNQPGSGERAQVLTDVLEVEQGSGAGGQGSGPKGAYAFIRPLLIALPNRHNVLIDQQTNTLAGWWTGDAAMQRTRGKSWYWEPAGVAFWPLGKPLGADLALRRGTRLLLPEPQGQHVSPFETLEHIPDGIRFTHRLRFSDPDHDIRELKITQTLTAIWRDQTSGAGFHRKFQVAGLARGEQLIVQPLPGQSIQATRDGRGWDLAGPDNCRVRLERLEGAEFVNSGEAGSFAIAPLPRSNQPLVCELSYTSARPVDQSATTPAGPPLPALPLSVTPGYEAVRLPLAEAEMPTALAWRADGTLVVCSLKGRVCLARDTNGDGLEDTIEPFSDELAAPYGAAAHEGAIDVITKYALLRLHDANQDGRVDRTEVLAAGWGHSTDYHDWAVGLPRDERGNYYVALPCQQDDRSPEAAFLRGRGLKISPRSSNSEGPYPYTIEPFCEGLRFPMGVAMNRQGLLFATDNQGNYNPFNELNNLLPGHHYGFINKLEFKAGERPPLTPPALDIPHPWTRSVNGICFLETPAALREKLGRDVFGPHEGHLVGCEYDSRQLVRMSLQQVGDTWQGAIYPFTAPPAEGQQPLQGPVCCAVSPVGDLYVGSMRDSGWGGGANVGSIARVRPTGNLPAGIAEVRATPRGFSILFAQAVDARLAANAGNYAVASYRRVSTPAYGGPDVDRKSHKIRSAALSPDRRQVEIQLDELRAGFVYEIRLQDLAPAAQEFYPAEAHYTLRAAPR